MSNNRILVVDDSKEIANVAKIMLESAGYICITATNGHECLEKISKDRFDLVLLDLAMPEFTGLDVINRLSDSGLLDHTKVIFFTSSNGISEIADCKKLGVAGCIKKPFRKGELLSAVRSFIET